MRYSIRITIQDICSIDLCEINIPEEEWRNAEDAFKCEMEYNGFDMVI